MAKPTFEEVLAEIFDGKCELACAARRDQQHPLSMDKATLAVLAYIAYKLAQLQGEANGI